MKNKAKENLNLLGQNIAEAIEAIQPKDVLETIKASQLIDVSTWRDKQKKLVLDNKFFDIVDNKTYELGKKHRTNVVKGRTELQNQDKLVASTFAAVRKEVGSETAILIEITQPLEDKWQEAIKAWEARKELEKQAAKEAEELRVKNINEKIESFETDSYTIIQSMKFDDIDSAKNKLASLHDDEFDFEEFDLLYDLAQDRVTESYTSKTKSLTENENQRLDNVRLEAANAEAKRIADLQASRLNEIMPYVAFGESLDLTRLSYLDIDVYSFILSSKKALFDADFKNKQKEEQKRLAKEEEEKEAIYGIREKRLLELGMQYSDEHDTFWLKENDDYILLKDDVIDWSALDFENTYIEVKEIIRIANEKIEKEKVFEIRKNRLSEIGFSLNDEKVFVHPDLFIGISYESIFESDAVGFEKIINDAKLAIENVLIKHESDKKRELIFKDAGMPFGDNGVINFYTGNDMWFTVEKHQILDSTQEQFDNTLKLAKEAFFKHRSLSIESLGYKYNQENDRFEMEGFLSYPAENVLLKTSEFEYWMSTVEDQVRDVNERLAIADAEKLKAENKARIAKYARDKKYLQEFVKSLEFRNAVPELENDDMQPILDKILLELDNTRGFLLTNINLF